MLRVITRSTHRRFQEAVTEAARIPGLESELADLRRELEIVQAGKREAARTAEDLEDARQAGAEIAAALTQPDALQREAIRSVAASLVRHAPGLGLDVKRLHSGKPYQAAPASSADGEAPRPHPESGDGAHLPHVHVYVHQGEIRSVHRLSEDAVRQAHAAGAPPEGWCQDANCSETSRPMPYSVYPLRVWESWPDRSHVHLLLSGNQPVAAYGTEQAARRACVLTKMATTGLALSVSTWPMDGSQPSPVPATAQDEGLAIEGEVARRKHALMLAAMVSGKCAAMRRNEVEPPDDFLQLCANLRAAAVNLAVTEDEIDEVARPWAALL